jgi:hypothetical protein
VSILKITTAMAQDSGGFIIRLDVVLVALDARHYIRVKPAVVADCTIAPRVGSTARDFNLAKVKSAQNKKLNLISAGHNFILSYAWFYGCTIFWNARF